MIEELNVYPADYKDRLQVWNDFVDVFLKNNEIFAMEVYDCDLQTFWNKLFEGYPIIQEFYSLNNEDE